MKCNICKNKIEKCSGCSNIFEIKDTIICFNEDIHVCNHECLFDYLARKGDACISEVKK